MKRIIMTLAAVWICIAAAGQQTAGQAAVRQAVVALSGIYMRIAPDYESALETQELMGTVVEVTGEKGYWREIISPQPYKAWCTEKGIVEMSPEAIKAYEAAPKCIFTELYGHIYERPSCKAATICDLVGGDVLRLTRGKGKIAGQAGNDGEGEGKDGKSKGGDRKGKIAGQAGNDDEGEGKDGKSKGGDRMGKIAGQAGNDGEGEGKGGDRMGKIAGQAGNDDEGEGNDGKSKGGDRKGKIAGQAGNDGKGEGNDGKSKGGDRKGKIAGQAGNDGEGEGNDDESKGGDRKGKIAGQAGNDGEGEGKEGEGKGEIAGQAGNDGEGEGKGGKGKKGRWTAVMLPSGQAGWVKSCQIKPHEGFRSIAMGEGSAESISDRQMEEIISTAFRLKGVPYLWGGMTPKGVDCSGLVRWSFLMNGILLPRNASQMISCGDEVPLTPPQDGKAAGLENLRRGDLVFFGTPARDGAKQRVTHVGIYIGNNLIIHSSHLVRVNSLIPGDEDYYENAHKLIAARRL